MAIKQLRFQFEALSVDLSDSTALFRQLENQIREAIWQERLSAGERLPSTRHLAKQLGIARNTVINAYEQLTVEGFIVTRHGSGTHVTDNFPQRDSILKKKSNELTVSIEPFDFSTRYQRLVSHNVSISQGGSGATRPFRANIPNYFEFPKAQWAQLVTKRLRQKTASWMEKVHPCGYEPLRAAIASYLGAARGLSTTGEQVIVTAGAQQAIELLAKLLINPGDIVCFEDPGYTHAAMVFELAGAKVVTVPVDEDGLDVDELRKTVSKAKLIYVTPANHFPLCVTLSQSRRQALLQWAKETGAIILEDDYNGEYRYRGRPLPTLHTMASEGRVIYIGSFSKLLFPALRLGYMVVSHQLIEPLSSIRWLLDRHSPALEQIVLTDFINQGHFSRHIRRMRVLYAERQKALLDAAKEYLVGILDVPPLDGGLHLIGWLQVGVVQKDVLAAAANVEIELISTSLFSFKEPAKEGIVFGYAPYSTDSIRHSMKELRAAYFKLKDRNVLL
ncbi:PLP-dependent aminotransferase family protein [Neptunomonas japonica]|uniref:MocR-like pyridoxine biosynthesis transcription factor PdxR n=1 Tax=Neptunomonas japonica TaxID=417574 RepID=UPI000401CD0C|nr:PLP-dependent aminotransferase family protein [Neptunomonas japonica]